VRIREEDRNLVGKVLKGYLKSNFSKNMMTMAYGWPAKVNFKCQPTLKHHKPRNIASKGLNHIQPNGSTSVSAVNSV
jgi:hypothetical protein